MFKDKLVSDQQREKTLKKHLLQLKISPLTVYHHGAEHQDAPRSPVKYWILILFLALSTPSLPFLLTYSALFYFAKVKMLVTQSCLTPCLLMNCSPSGFSVHAVLQARKLQWIAMLFSWVSSRPRD